MRVLKVKTRIPPVTENVVLRPTLYNRLDDGMLLGCKLVLVSAPAGYGKTTLLASWARNRARYTEPQRAAADCTAFAWVPLDPSLDDPKAFLLYLLTSAGTVWDGATAEAMAMLTCSQPAHWRVVVEALAAGIEEEAAVRREAAAIVLDDYQFITDGVVHEAVRALLDSLPENVHLVISTRVDPPLPTACLRAKGQLVEVRAADLRFSVEEVGDFCARVMGIGLDWRHVELLEARTEGWAAGVQLAALSLAGKPDPGQAVAAFSGEHHFVMGYMADEVLSGLPADVQRFMADTSVLRRLSAPLCDAVTGMEGSGAKLDALERANLFLVPMDDERQWFRYHHLFSDLLQVRLKAGGRDHVAELHRRASRWFESAGLTAEAVDHALAAGDAERAADLVERDTVELFARGELNSLIRWVKALPAEVSQERTWLRIYQAWALAFGGYGEQVDTILCGAAVGGSRRRWTGPMQQLGEERGSVGDWICIPPAGRFRRRRAGLREHGCSGRRDAERLDHRYRPH